MKHLLEERYYLAEDTLASKKKFTSWEAYYAECNTKEEFAAFWDGDKNSSEDIKKLGYFKAEFGDTASKIKSLGVPFLETLTDYGFKADQNIFIAWLKLLEKTAPNKVSLSTINMPDIRALKSAYDSGYLKDVDFLINGSTLHKFNLIFNPNFYDLQSEEQLYLLELQNSFVNSSNLKGITDLGVAFANLYSETGTPNNLTNTNILPGAKLRSTKMLKTLLAKLGADKVSVTTDQISKIIKMFNDETSCTEAIVYLYDAFSLILPEAIQQADSTTNKKITSIRKTYKLGLPLGTQEKLKKVFKLGKGIPYTKAQGTKLLTELLKKLEEVK